TRETRVSGESAQASGAGRRSRRPRCSRDSRRTARRNQPLPRSGIQPGREAARGNRSWTIMKRAFRLLVFYAGLLGLWALLAELKLWPPYLFPAPWGVGDALYAGFQ